MKRSFHSITVLMGGPSSERKISLLTGQAVLEGLLEAGYDADLVTVTEHAEFSLPEKTEAVFVALHGTFGEDGGVQTELERLKIPYTGSRPASARLSFDKIRSRAAFASAGIPIPPGYVIPAGADPGTPALELPLVVKPPREGSSVGITIVTRPEDYAAAIKTARAYNEEVLVETFIPGREWTVPIVGETVLPVVDISPKNKAGWYDWTAKYQSGGTTRYTFPADDPADVRLAETVQHLARSAFDAVNAWSLARIDFRVTPDHSPYVLELNAIPGCTGNSLLPKSAAKAGLSFPELCARIMEDAKCG